jgi:hypothetical protein
MIKTTIAALAIATAAVLPVMADEGVMPQGSKIIVNKSEAQQGVAKGHGAKSGKRHVAHKHMAAKKAPAHKHHRAHKAAAAPVAKSKAAM